MSRFAEIEFDNPSYREVSAQASIHPTVTISPFCIVGDNVRIGKNVKIGNFCEIRDGCMIGDNTHLGARCTLAAGTIVGKDCDLKYGFVATDTPKVGESMKTPCTIGDGVRAGANVTIMPGVRIGNNATIGACSQVRHDIPDGQTWWGNPAGPNGCQVEEGAQKVDGKFIHSEGGMDIHPSVHFQSHVSVKRGLWKGTNTKIGEGTYVCSFANVGHNVQIGKDCFIATGAKLLGNVVLGNNVYVGSNAVVAPNHKIGDWVKVRAGEVVNCDIPSGTYYGKGGKMVKNRYGPSPS